MKIPKMLENYLEETEQNSEEMSISDLLEAAKWVDGEYYDTDEYTCNDVVALKWFIRKYEKV